MKRRIEEARSGNEALLDEVGRLERRIFPKHESLASDLRNEVARRKCTLLCCCLEPNDVVVGYVMISWASSLAASITKLAVKEGYRRQGHGEALMQAALQRCHLRRVQCVNLHVDPCRTAALALYQKLGFRIDSLIEAYYAPGRDAHRLVLELCSNGETVPNLESVRGESGQISLACEL